MLDNDYQAPNNFQQRVKQRINAIDMFDSDYVITGNSEIPSVASTLKKIYISKTILN